jgi:hypothetical protein
LVGAQLLGAKKKHAAAIVEKINDLFAISPEKIGEFKVFEVQLDLKTDQPIF